MSEFKFPERLRWLRTEHLKVTFKSLANMANTSPGYLSDLEKGVKTNPSRSLLENLCNAAGVRFGWLSSGEGVPFESDADRIIRSEPAATKQSYMKLSELDEGAVPSKEDFHAYIDRVIETMEGDEEGIRRAYSRLRRFVPIKLPDENPLSRRASEMTRACSLFVNSVYPNEELLARVLMDTLIGFAYKKLANQMGNDQKKDLSNVQSEVLDNLMSHYEGILQGVKVASKKPPVDKPDDSLKELSKFSLDDELPPRVAEALDKSMAELAKFAREKAALERRSQIQEATP